MELVIDNIAHGGVCVARHHGRVIFVSDTIPGEKVLALISDTSHASYARAETVEVLEPSELRQVHIWPEASLHRDPSQRAGGADYGHIILSHQRVLKQDVLQDSLKRFGKIEREVVVEAVADDEATGGLNWRTRVSLQVNSEGKVGPYASRSHEVIPVESLPLASRELQAIAPLGQNFEGVDRIDLVAPSGTSALILETKQGSTPEPHPITERVGSREFHLDARGFWQVHTHAATTLSHAITEMIDRDHFDPAAANHDLYGGVGLFAVALAELGGPSTQITSVESAEVASDYAARNLTEWIGARVYQSPVEAYLRSVHKNLTQNRAQQWRQATIVIDPPRSGAGKKVVDYLGKLSPTQIVYVACDPVAFSRDVAYFSQHGYQVSRIRAFDLFPNTHHMEVVALLTRG